MRAKKIISWIHLILGLASGIPVCIVALTGCLYAFKTEIESLTEDYRKVEPQLTGYLPPSRLSELAQKELPGKKIHSVAYESAQRAASVSFWQGGEDGYYYHVYLNPYSGKTLKIKNENAGFFRWVLNGHFYLWLPEKTGRPIVSFATVIFVVLIISGLILWWPRNRSAAKQRFTIKWNAKWRRKNYDLHNVMGFYMMSVGLVLAITGLVWCFDWFANKYYYVASGGKNFSEYSEPLSVRNSAPYTNALDIVWQKMLDEYPNHLVEVHPAESDSGSIAANANPDPATYWKTDYRYFDQYSLKELKVDHIWGRIQEAGAGDKVMRMNYDIHVGAVLGLPGKILVFCASLIIASLPVTGFMIWYGRKYKTKKKSKTPLRTEKEEFSLV